MSTQTSKRTTSSKAVAADVATEESVEKDVKFEGETKSATSSPKAKIKAKDVDLNQYITVRNGFQGMLIYVSKKTGEVFEWDEFGAEQEMELGELKNAKNSNKNFFINNWFMFDDPWVIDFLGVGQFYKNTLPIDNFDDVFKMDADEAVKVLRDIPDGQKRSVAYRARQLISENAIDSMNLIKALEKELGIDLIEH